MEEPSPPPPYVIGIVVYNDVDLLDVAVPAELFNWMGVVEQQSGSNKPQRVVRLVSADGPSVVTRDGLSLGAGLPPLEDAGTIDLLWVPGADLRRLGKLMLDARLIGFLQRHSATAHFTVSVCEGALLLAAAGLLDGYRATTHWAFRGCLARFPAIDVAPYYPRYVVDGNRITGGGISSGLDEALLIISMISSPEVARTVQLNVQYNPRPPFGDGDPTVAEQPKILAPGATDYIDGTLAPFIDQVLDRVKSGGSARAKGDTGTASRTSPG